MCHVEFTTDWHVAVMATLLPQTLADNGCCEKGKVERPSCSNSVNQTCRDSAEKRSSAGRT